MHVARRTRRRVHAAATASETARGRRARLRFSSDREPGIRRVRCGRGFAYLDPAGRRVADARLIARVRSLAIPPAYRDVWICRDARGHLQAAGRDARGRKQYRYHPDWRLHRDAVKFDHILDFGRALPRIRRRVAVDLRRPGLPRGKVLATIVKLLETTLVRVGNEEYARVNGSFGLTTLRNRHVRRRNGHLCFEFRGKSGIVHCVEVSDPAIARIVQRCAEIPGQELFQWMDAQGTRHRVHSHDVNDYLREAGDGPFTAKDYRTWFATLNALDGLRRQPAGATRELRRQAKSVVAEVAGRLGNTPAICRKSYIHPRVLEAHAAGDLQRLAATRPEAALRELLRAGRGGTARQPQTAALALEGARAPVASAARAGRRRPGVARLPHEARSDPSYGTIGRGRAPPRSRPDGGHAGPREMMRQPGAPAAAQA